MSPDPSTRTGVWAERGFHVEFGGDLVDGLYDSRNIALSQAYISDEGCCGDSYTHFEISRADGATFSFDGMELTRSFSDTWVQGSFQAFDGTGALQPALSSYESARLNYDNLRLHGTRADGSEVEVFASGFTDTAPNTNVEIDPNTLYAESGTELILDLDPADQAALSNLTSLRIEAGTYQSRFDIYADSFRFVGENSTLNPFSGRGLSDNMMIGYVECLLIRQQESCVVDGLGAFSFYQTQQRHQNYGSATTIGALQFSVAPAPVPLPAGGWLLLAGAGALVALRRRARSNA